MANIELVVDCDPGWDDACALAVLFGTTTQHVLLQAITTVYGNRCLDVTTDHAKRLTAYCGKSFLRVHPGCTKPLKGDPITSPAKPSRVLDNLPKNDDPAARPDAADFILAQVNSCSATTVLATGPLTNIATAIDRNLKVLKKIHSLVIVAGATTNGATEFNAACDLMAIEQTVQSGLKPVLIPFETCEQITNRYLLPALRAKGTRLAKLYVDIVQDQLDQDNPGVDNGLYDVVGALYVLKPELFSLEQQIVKVDARGWIHPDPSGGPVQIAKLADVIGAYELVINSLSLF